MKLLLDTHIWLRSLGDPDKLTRKVRRHLEHPGNELFLSPISVWEAGHLVRRKKLRVKGSFHGWLARALQVKPLTEAPITIEVAAEVWRLHLEQPDLGDLFLAATASVYGLTLVTEDGQLLACSWLKTLN